MNYSLIHFFPSTDPYLCNKTDPDFQLQSDFRFLYPRTDPDIFNNPDPDPFNEQG